MPLLPHLPPDLTPTFTQQEDHAQGHRDAPHSFSRPLTGLPSWSSLPTVWTAAMSPQLTFPPEHPSRFNLPFIVRQSQFSDGSPFTVPSSFSEILSSCQLDKIHISQTLPSIISQPPHFCNNHLLSSQILHATHQTVATSLNPPVTQSPSLPQAPPEQITRRASSSLLL